MAKKYLQYVGTTCGTQITTKNILTDCIKYENARKLFIIIPLRNPRTPTEKEQQNNTFLKKKKNQIYTKLI